jgi:membrane-associated PAP2 superfamily phosphatase
MVDTNSRFWIRHAVIPGVLLMAALATVAIWRLDLRIADAWFYDRADGVWLGADTWWAVGLIHTGGAWLVRIAGLAALGTLAASFWHVRLANLQRAAAFLVAGLLICPAAVGALKQITNVDCPRDLQHYGGTSPYVELLGDRPDRLPRARCFPGAHAASGFALMSLYFVLLGRRPKLARRSLAGAILIGAVFSVGQQARGAHFLSHDLVSATLAWFLQLGLFRRLLLSGHPVGSRLIPRHTDVPPPDDGVSRHGLALVRRPATHPAPACGRGAGVRGVFQRVLRARVPVRPPAAQWGRRGREGSRAVHPRQGDAQDGGLPRRLRALHMAVPDLSP